MKSFLQVVLGILLWPILVVGAILFAQGWTIALLVFITVTIVIGREVYLKRVITLPRRKG